MKILLMEIKFENYPLTNFLMENVNTKKAILKLTPAFIAVPSQAWYTCMHL